ncbi:MAG TPA: efflux RND transporter periplasmic adaptor subunit [Verrucomicrobiae bacterium]|jgi:RND family efflux transporter MFP subunit
MRTFNSLIAKNVRVFSAVLAGLLVSAVCARAADPVTISGITQPFMDVTLGLADAGIIHEEFFKEGDAVKKGDAILELDKSLETIEVERRQAVMDQDKMIYESTAELAKNTKSVSKTDLAKATAQYNVSTAEYHTAVQELANRELMAPFSGTIVEIQLHPGAAVAPYQSVVRLVDTSRCYFIGHVDGVSASNLHLEQAVKIKVDGGQTVSGKIVYISPTVDAASGLARIKAIFDNADGKIRPGLAAQMTVE